MKLFYSKGACSLAPIILAEWLELPLDIEAVDNKNPTEEYLRVNPLGAVPALQLDDGSAWTQVDAILQYFCGLKPEAGLDAGDDPLDRFTLHRWVAFLTGDYHPPFGAWFNPRRFTTDHSDASLAKVKAAMAERIGRLATVLDAQVGDSDHIVLGRRTFVDAYAYAMLRWLNLLERKLGAYPNLDRFMARMSEDAGVKQALEREQG